MYQKIESSFAFKPYKNDVFVKTFKTQTFNQNGKKNAISKNLFYSPPVLIFQHSSVSEEMKNVEVHRMRNGFNIDVFTKFDIKEIVKIGGKVIQ